MLHTQVSFRANFITPDSDLGTGFQAMMLERYLEEHAIVLHTADKPHVAGDSPLAPVIPVDNLWVVSHDSDIDDSLGGGFCITTPPMHHLMLAPTALKNLLGFIKEQGITDEMCRLQVTFHVDGLRDVNPLKFLLLFDEPKHIENWSKFGKLRCKSHYDHMAAVIHTNRYWHGEVRPWMEQAHKHLDYGTGYGIDLGHIGDNKLTLNLIQGPHYEHRESHVVSTLMDATEALKYSLNGDPEGDLEFFERARDFWCEHVQAVHPQARFTPPRG